jgi:hypothetical protein
MRSISRRRCFCAKHRRRWCGTQSSCCDSGAGMRIVRAVSALSCPQERSSSMQLQPPRSKTTNTVNAANMLSRPGRQCFMSTRTAAFDDDDDDAKRARAECCTVVARLASAAMTFAPCHPRPMRAIWVNSYSVDWALRRRRQWAPDGTRGSCIAGQVGCAPADQGNVRSGRDVSCAERCFRRKHPRTRRVHASRNGGLHLGQHSAARLQARMTWVVVMQRGLEASTGLVSAVARAPASVTPADPPPDAAPPPQPLRRGLAAPNRPTRTTAAVPDGAETKESAEKRAFVARCCRRLTCVARRENCGAAATLCWALRTPRGFGAASCCAPPSRAERAAKPMHVRTHAAAQQAREPAPP